MAPLSKEQFAQAVIISVKVFCSTMLMTEAQAGPLLIRRYEDVKAQVLTSIGIAGGISGSLLLFFKSEGACKLAGAMMGEEYDSVTAEVMDALGESTNIIAGGAKKELGAFGLNFHLSIPQVFVSEGSASVASHVRSGTFLYIVPFKSPDIGSFLVAFSIP